MATPLLSKEIGLVILFVVEVDSSITLRLTKSCFPSITNF